MKFAIIDEPLIKYRVRSNNISNSNPLKQYLLKEYIQKLYNQRMKNGNDDFSVDNLNKYLKKHNAFENKNIEKYKLGLKYFNEFKMNIKEKKVLKSFKYITKALFAHKKIKNLLYDYMVSYCLKKK